MFAAKRNILMPILAVIGALLAPAAALAAPPQSAATPAVVAPASGLQMPLAEPRWLPWLGCWELTADAVDYREVEDTGDRVVCVTPRPDGLGVSLTTHVNREVIAESTVIADGQPRPVVEPGCSGQQRNAWSSDGRRLHSSTEASCEAGSRRSLNGISMLVSGTEWLELQSMSFDGGKHRELLVRRYKRLNDAQTQSLGFTPLSPAVAVEAATARAAAAGPLDMDDVIELTERAPVEVVEAAVLESYSVFPIDSDALMRLVDAGVEERVIDLMVAVSFPEQFMVETAPPPPPPAAPVPYLGVYPTFYSGCRGPWGPTYGPYGCDPWFSPWGYGWYRPYRPGRPPYYGGGGGVVIKVPPTGSLYGGRVVSDKGYSRVRRLEPTPHGDGGFSGGSSKNGNSGSGFGGAVRRAFRRDGGSSSGGSVGSSSRSSGGGKSGGSVSRGGFRRSGGSSSGSSGGSSSGSSGGSSSGSSGGSSGAKAKAKAKPRGGTGA